MRSSTFDGRKHATVEVALFGLLVFVFVFCFFFKYAVP